MMRTSGRTRPMQIALGLAVAFHLLVVGYEEPTLRKRFGTPYEEYRHAVSRWVPRKPKE